MKFNASPERTGTWNIYSIEDICSTFTSGGTPSRKKPEFYIDGTIPWVKTKELVDDIIFSAEEHITQEALNSSSAKMLPTNTVMLAMYGATVGRLGILGIPATCNQAAAAMVVDPTKADFRFLYYLLLNHREEIIGLATGGAQQNLSGQLIRKFEFGFPQMPQQNLIGKILFNLDDKIRKNNSISKTLEDIAQTIFKSWFIDFDPVKAKMAGEKPVGMDAATAALFPDSMEDSELGLIPKGWKVRTIGDSVIKQKVGKLYDSKTSSPSGKVPVLDQGKSGFVGFHDDEPGVIATPDSPLVVFANHTCLLRLISFPFSVIQNVFPLVGNNVDTIWLYFAVDGKQQFDSYKGHWPDFVLHKVIYPPTEVTSQFMKVVAPFLQKKWLAAEENQSLTSIRDSLLPRLISGELQIPEEMLAS
jgi:type I restriction enzyme S subunit